MSTVTSPLAVRYTQSFLGASQVIAEFATKVVENPAYAFTWGAKAVNAAAEIEVYGYVLAMVGNDKIEPDALAARLEAAVLRQVMHGASNPPSSTSAMANLVEQAKTKVWADLLADLRSLRGEY